MRVLMIALLLAVSVPAFAEPSKTPKFLIDRKISLFDWGIYKLDQEMSSRVSSRLSSRWTDAELIHGEAEYDWDTNRIWLRVTFFGTAASPESCVAAAKAIKDRFLILIDTDTADDGAILAQAASELSAIFSHPGGYKANSRPDDVGEQLTHITNIEAALFGPIEATNRTQRPDYRCQTTFRSKEVAVIVDQKVKTTPEKSLDIYLSQARSHGLEREFWLSYREYKPWWAFWVSEAEAAAEALIDLDLQGQRAGE